MYLGLGYTIFLHANIIFHAMNISNVINYEPNGYLSVYRNELLETEIGGWSYYTSFHLNGIIAVGWFNNDDILILSADGIFVFGMLEKSIIYEDYGRFKQYIPSDNLTYFFQERNETLQIFGLRGGNGNCFTRKISWTLDIINLSYDKRIVKLSNYNQQSQYAFLEMKKATYEDILFMGFSKNEQYFLIMGNNGVDIWQYKLLK
jgi:hypothetical protein